MGGIAYWLGALLIRFPDSSRGEKPRSEVELRLTRNGLEILKLEMKDQTYMFEMCKKAVDSWILNNPGDPDHAVKIVNDTLKQYRTKIEKAGNSFIIDFQDNR